MAIGVSKFPKKKVSRYKNIRRFIQSGDLLFCSGNKWTSRTIRAATGSCWSHIAFVMRLDAIDRIMVMESVESQGVRTVPLSKYLKNYDNRNQPYDGGVAIGRHGKFDGIVSKKRLKKFARRAVQLLGHRYDRDEIAKICGRIVASHLPFSKNETVRLERDNEYICSEYVWECYRSLGIEIPNDTRGFVSPADFARAEEVALLYVLQGIGV